MKQCPARRALLLFAAGIALNAPAAAQTRPPAEALRGFDEYVAKSMKEWEVPGLAIAIVKGDSVVFAKGYGVRTLGRPEPVDTRTQFAIASVTKAFTAALVGMLVDEGKVKWDDPAQKHLPGFQLFDPYVSREITVRDLLSHRSGLPRGDLTWYATENTPAEVVRRVRFIRPQSSLRSQYGYQNIMYLAAGQVIENVAGKPWEQAVRERIFAPLGMTETSTSISAFRGNPNVASPHDRIEDTVRVIAWRNWDNVGAAGAINSNVQDMAKWVRFQLDSARVGSKPLLASATFTETHMPQTVVRREGQAREINPVTHFTSYGLGWFLDDFRGRELVRHGGNLDGMSSMVAMMPEEDLGLVILTNMDGTLLRDLLMWKAFDLFLGAPPKDWSGDALKVQQKSLAAAKETERKREAARKTGTSPSLPLAAYVGTYADSLYGRVEVRQDGGRLLARFGPAFVGELEHWHFNTFRARWQDRSLGRSMLDFDLDIEGKVSRLAMEGIGEFRREDRADTTAAVRLTEAELAKFAGAYRANEAALTVRAEVIGGVLKLTIPGQPAYTLVAETRTRFRLTGGEIGRGFFAEFRVADGRVTGMTLEQPSPRPTLTFVPVAPTTAATSTAR